MYLKEDRTLPDIDIKEDGAIDETEWNDLWEQMAGFMEKQALLYTLYFTLHSLPFTLNIP